jgi:hypothetical protein
VNTGYYVIAPIADNPFGVWPSAVEAGVPAPDL